MESLEPLDYKLNALVIELGVMKASAGKDSSSSRWKVLHHYISEVDFSSVKYIIFATEHRIFWYQQKRHSDDK